MLTTVSPVTLIALAAVKNASEKASFIPGLRAIGKYNKQDPINIKTK